MDPSIQPSSPQRALAAIVLTDAVSFSARMSVDEEGTLALIQRDLKLIADLCERYGGQVLKSTGDGLLMSFYSAVQAVNCSQEVQKELARLAEGLSPEEYLQHRIGIHLGDVLFSHADVLGNGVNIAARLQTQATPGGICISQTVYDVVKARLDINATYLGPLKLKNIREPVPAFQIPPVGQSATIMVAPSPAAPQLAVSDPLAIAVQTLEQDEQQHRIKKLIFGTCQGMWENSPTVLGQYHLSALLEKLCQRYRTSAALEAALRSVVLRLNHKTEYLAVVETILTALEPFYRERTNADEAAAVVTEEQTRYRAVATHLCQQSHAVRIKKLLHALVYKTWENDPAVLAQQEMEALVREVHQVAPTEVDLSYHLERIVKRLNRRSLYTQVALTISDAFQPLYGLTSETSLMTADATTMEASVEETVMSTGETAEDGGLTSVTHFENPPSADPPGPVVNSLPDPDAERQAQAIARRSDRSQRFNLRLEIMRYTNPLRAKILLLSTVRSPFTFSRQDWITLKSKTMDDLIQDTFEYCRSYSDLESKLTIMCHCVDNLEENLQASGAILQALRPFYP